MRQQCCCCTWLGVWRASVLVPPAVQTKAGGPASAGWAPVACYRRGSSWLAPCPRRSAQPRGSGPLSDDRARPARAATPSHAAPCADEAPPRASAPPRVQSAAGGHPVRRHPPAPPRCCMQRSAWRPRAGSAALLPGGGLLAARPDRITWLHQRLRLLDSSFSQWIVHRNLSELAPAA